MAKKIATKTSASKNATKAKASTKAVSTKPQTKKAKAKPAAKRRAAPILKKAIPLKSWKPGDKVRFVNDKGQQIPRTFTVMKLDAWLKKFAPPLNKFVPIEEHSLFYHKDELSVAS